METAKVLNKINPEFIRILTIAVKKGSGLEKQLEEGTFQLQTEKAMIEEQRLLIDSLDGITSYFTNHHGIDLLMEVCGQLPTDKPNLLVIMDHYLSLSKEDQINDTFAKCFGYYRVAA
jgi:hypothetical protein